MAYFLVSVSSKENLDLCTKYALAGFTNSINGVWTFSDIQKGDFISFLYGARAHNLYLVEEKEALKDALTLPPWKPITFKMSGLTYDFPFRLHLKPIRKLNESLVRAEFAYVAENLLLRGGYRKTHFQADQTTLQNASQLGELYNESTEKLSIEGCETFIPHFSKFQHKSAPPEVFRFLEIILQAVLRQHLSDEKNLAVFLQLINQKNSSSEVFEVLGEKALAEGHIDILIKEATPKGLSRKIIVEVKTGLANIQDIHQLSHYTSEIGYECLAGVLIARGFSRITLQEAKRLGVTTLTYQLKILENRELVTFNELKEDLRLA